MSLEATTLDVLAAYDRGDLTHGEALSRFVDALDQHNITQIVAVLPEPWRTWFTEDLEQRAEINSPDDLLFLEGTLFAWEFEPDERKREQMRAEHQSKLKAKREHYWNITLPAIRSWLTARKL